MKSRQQAKLAKTVLKAMFWPELGSESAFQAPDPWVCVDQFLREELSSSALDAFPGLFATCRL